MFVSFASGTCVACLLEDSVLVVAEETYPEEDIFTIHSGFPHPTLHSTHEVIKSIGPAPGYKMRHPASFWRFQARIKHHKSSTTLYNSKLYNYTTKTRKAEQAGLRMFKKKSAYIAYMCHKKIGLLECLSTLPMFHVLQAMLAAQYCVATACYSCYNVLLSTTQYSALQRTTTCYSIRLRSATCCNDLQRTYYKLHTIQYQYNVFLRTTTHYKVLQRNTPYYNVRYNILFPNAAPATKSHT